MNRANIGGETEEGTEEFGGVIRFGRGEDEWDGSTPKIPGISRVAKNVK